jgi:hypothetical protein
MDTEVGVQPRSAIQARRLRVSAPSFQDFANYDKPISACVSALASKRYRKQKEFAAKDRKEHKRRKRICRSKTTAVDSCRNLIERDQPKQD